ncbi:MAG: efflux RND transporter periplasmic adaptor subunit [Rubrivivax sp.]
MNPSANDTPVDMSPRPAVAPPGPPSVAPSSEPSAPASKTVLTVLVLLLLLGAVAGAWWLGRRQGQSQSITTGPAATAAAAPANPAAATDPTRWSIPQGEEATRRHIRDGLKAGDTDPVTGLSILNYHDPMVPGKNFEAPAKSPFMDMMLVPRYAGGGGADAGTITVSPRIQQNLGLRTEAVVAGSLASVVTAVGSVAWNERDQVLLQARATGFVEKLNVRATLDRVQRGAVLAEIYVPQWVAAQEEYLALARMQGDDLAPLRDAARQRMRLAGMSEPQIEHVVQSGAVQARFELRAPQGGIVTELMVREGATVMPGMTLVRIQGTGTVWAEGEVAESQAALLKPGARVSATSPAVPGQRFEGKVQALLPAVDAATRTLKVRMELANPSGRLVPGMFVQMRFERPMRDAVLLVPSDAVIRTGSRSLVMLAEADGRFRPVEVDIGLEADGRTEITKGLKEGDRVVRSGQFLIDSESSLRGLQARLNPPPETGMAASAAASAALPTYRTPATIDAIEGDTITLSHPPIAALKWPQMQMGFRVSPQTRRSPGLAAGQRVQVEFTRPDGDLPVLTQIGPVSPASGAAPAPAGGKP